MNDPAIWCVPLLAEPMSPEGAEQLANQLKVLAEPARLRLLSLIASHPGGEACECVLVQPLGLSQPTVNHHLKVLQAAGFLHRERRGVWAYYRVLPGPLALIRDALAAPRAAPRSAPSPAIAAARAN